MSTTMNNLSLQSFVSKVWGKTKKTPAKISLSMFIISNQDAILSNYAKRLENVIAYIKCYKNKQEDKEAILLILHQTMLLNIMHACIYIYMHLADAFIQ